MGLLSKIHQILNTPLEGVYQSSSNVTAQGESELVFRRCKNFRFELKAPEAQSVFLTGDFTNWDPAGIPLAKNEDGLWWTEIHLPSGRYEYKFIVDHQWCLDPVNSQTVQNSFGAKNSVKQFSV